MDVAIPIISLQILGILDNGVGLDETTQHRVVIPCLVIVEPGLDVIHLAGITRIKLQVWVEGVDLLTKRRVFKALENLSFFVGDAGMLGRLLSFRE